MQKVDYYLEDTSGVNWPNLPSYRTQYSRKGYASWEEAKQRELQIVRWCAARGYGGPDFRIKQRIRKGRKHGKERI